MVTLSGPRAPELFIRAWCFLVRVLCTHAHESCVVVARALTASRHSITFAVGRGWNVDGGLRMFVGCRSHVVDAYDWCAVVVLLHHHIHLMLECLFGGAGYCV